MISIRSSLPMRLLMAMFTFATASNRIFVHRNAFHRRFYSIRGGTSERRKYRAYIAVGSNLGDRYQNIKEAIQRLCQSGNSTLVTTSFLHETKPMYLNDQPHFLNGAIVVDTDREPLDLLKALKEIETELGRKANSIRNGPRPIDLDILFQQHTENGEHIVLDTESLVVPHPRIQEREFVLRPLSDISNDLKHPLLNQTILELYKELPKISEESPVRVLPLPRNRFLAFNRTLIMGILNVTPDSFSDGGRWNTSVEKAVARALEMEQEGADIIDIGGASTRPGAKEVAIEDEIQRTIPVIVGIRKVSDVPISIDTRHASVAKAAIEAGADVINDVSGGTFDELMIPTMVDLGVPVVLMHMRGNPETMQTLTQYDNVNEDVANELGIQSEVAEKAGILRWSLVMDPGIGFAKDMVGNLGLLANLGAFREYLRDCPVLLGTSRKGFIGRLTGVKEADKRDPGTIASCVAALCLEGSTSTCNIIRVHNVAAMKQATTVMDAIRQH